MPLTTQHDSPAAIGRCFWMLQQWEVRSTFFRISENDKLLKWNLMKYNKTVKAKLWRSYQIIPNPVKLVQEENFIVNVIYAINNVYLKAVWRWIRQKYDSLFGWHVSHFNFKFSSLSYAPSEEPVYHGRSFRWLFYNSTTSLSCRLLLFMCNSLW